MRRRASPPGAAASTGLLAALAGVLAYSWWASGQQPFRPAAYVACAIPIVLVTLATLAATSRPPAGDARLPRLGAALLLALVAAWIALEAAALAAGGRSTALPTLSTFADELTAHHVSRFVAFVLWLTVGAALARAARPRRTRTETP